MDAVLPSIRSDPTPADRTAVERYLVDGTPFPDADLLARYGLSVHAFAAAPDAERHAPGRVAFMAAAAWHLHTKAAVMALAEAWHGRGVSALVYKGFYLADRVFEHAALRRYADVDVVVAEEDVGTALEVAAEQGWTVYGRREDSVKNPYSHTAASLWKAGVTVEVHRFVVHCSTQRDAVQRRLTAAAWAASSDGGWPGTSLRVLDPRDSLLMGLVLNRAWSDDAWRLWPSDYLDARAVAMSFSLTRTDLVQRAVELGCGRTLALMLQRCDPWRGHIELRPPTLMQQQVWELEVVPERGLLVVERLSRAWRGAVTSAWPFLARAWRVSALLARDGDVAAYLQSSSTPKRRNGQATDRERQRVLRGVIFAARVVRPFGDREALRSIVLFEALRDVGVPATLYVSEADGGRSAAWVRIDDWHHPGAVVGDAGTADEGVRTFVTGAQPRSNGTEVRP